MAGPYYVRSTDGSDASDGLSWAEAKATLVGALAAVAAGETIYVSQNHAETQASAMTLTCPGTFAAPVNIICGNDAAEPPTATATSATVTTTGNNNMTFDGGFAYWYGIHFTAISGGTSGFLIFNDNLDWGHTFEQCVLELASSSQQAINILNSGSSTDSSFLHLKDTDIRFGSATQFLDGFSGRLLWDGGTLTGAQNSLFLMDGEPASVDVEIRGVDLSPMVSGDTIFDVDNATGDGNHDFRLVNCKLGAGVTIANTPANPGGPRVTSYNSDSGDTNYRFEYYDALGTILTETTIIRTSGASDGTTGISWQIDTTANTEWAFPFYTPWITGWIDSTGSKTWTAQIVHDSVTNLQNDEVWLEVEYLGTSGFPQSIIGDDRAADILATPADQSTTGDTWTTTGLTNPNTQDCSVTATVNEIGPWRARLGVNKASYTVYFCPLVEIT